MGCKHKYLEESAKQNLFEGRATRKNKILTVNHHQTSYLAEFLVKNAPHQLSGLTKVQLEARSLSGKGKCDVSVFAEKLSEHDAESESCLDLVREFTTDYVTIYDRLFLFGSFLAAGRMSYNVKRRPESTKEMMTMTTFKQPDSDGQITHTIIHLLVKADPDDNTKEQVMGWLDAAYAIEIASLKLLYNDVNLSRRAMLCWDITCGKIPLPKGSLLRKWDMIGPSRQKQVPVPPLRSAEKIDNVAEKSSEPPTVEKQLPHHPNKKLGGDNDKREGTGIRGKSERREKRIPLESDERKKEHEKSELSSKNVERGKGREQREPPRSGGREERDSSRKDDRSERLDLRKNGENESRSSSLETQPANRGFKKHI
ncbi:uncharacterized protein Bfra_010364 [Botrytis fragariae]|uniref:Uncharacterized protein n=1 Tax=Botrytis fragariae TaxID=1964551 RepID=A0A8H6ALZ9_9HELO|nr:uncharacterized protein Bfra_010364 [Botrytis fragariae]KAF5870218.1 hypothetical protein Bfra_010364 [Botrytis fragariae]